MHLDREFYYRTIRAKDSREIHQCRVIATRSRDERVIRALVAAMFATKMHRDAIASCVKNYIGARAIPALESLLPNLRADERLYQARLLCILGKSDAFPEYCSAVIELEPLKENVEKSVDWFLTNWTPKLLPGIRAALGLNDPRVLLLCAPYVHKYFPEEVSRRLSSVALDSALAQGVREAALKQLVSFSPDEAVLCILDSGCDYSLPAILLAMVELAASEEGHDLLPAVVREFEKTSDDRRIAAGFFNLAGDRTAGTESYKWLMSQVRLWLDTRDSPRSKPPAWLKVASRQLCRASQEEWISYLQAADEDGALWAFARDSLINSGHPAGLSTLRGEISVAATPEQMIKPCVDAIRLYREDAIDVLVKVQATGHPKLLQRIEQVVAKLWPGRSIDQLVDEYTTPTEASVQSEVSQPIGLQPTGETASDSPRARLPSRTERLRSSYDRDRALADRVKELELYCCQVCGRKLLNAGTGSPYAESHHIHPLGHQGSDTIENLLCLCPLCHRLFHLGCIGIDHELTVHSSGVASREHFLGVVRIAEGREISLKALRYHWAAMFIPSGDEQFDEREPELE